MGQNPNGTESTPLAQNFHGSSQTSSATFDNESPPETAASTKAASVDWNAKMMAIVVGATASITYISLSAAMILFNKYLMRVDVFPFPVMLTSLHMCGSLMFGMALHNLAPALFPAYPRVFGKHSDLDVETTANESIQDCDVNRGRCDFKATRTMKSLLPFAPIACCGALCLVTGNAAYKHASVSFLQVVKESHVMFVYVLMLLAGLEVFKLRMAAVLVFVSCCAMVAVYGEMYFSGMGLGLQLISGLSGSGQIVLNSLLMSRSSMGKVDPLTLVLCTAPVMLIALFPANVFFWDPSIPALLRQWLPYLAANACLAFALQVSAATLIWVASGTGYAMACVTKDLVIVAAAQAILHESFTGIQVMGFAGCVTGLSLYSAMKLFPELFERAE